MFAVPATRAVLSASKAMIATAASPPAAFSWAQPAAAAVALCAKSRRRRGRTPATAAEAGPSRSRLLLQARLGARKVYRRRRHIVFLVILKTCSQPNECPAFPATAAFRRILLSSIAMCVRVIAATAAHFGGMCVRLSVRLPGFGLGVDHGFWTSSSSPCSSSSSSRT